MRTLLKSCLVLALALLTVESVDAQKRYLGFTKKKQYWSFGAGLNTMHYWGDVAPNDSKFSTDFKKTKPNFSVFATKRLTPSVSVKAMYSVGAIGGDDANANDIGRSLRRNLHFRNIINEVSMVGIVDLFKNQGVYFRRPKIPIPYIGTGIVFYHHNPQTELVRGSGEWVNLQPMQTEGVEYSRFGIGIPLVVGVRYKLTNSIDISAEFNARILFTDYLDDISTEYAAIEDMNPAQAPAGTSPQDFAYKGDAYENYNDSLVGQKRGDPNQNDFYAIFGVQLSYILPGSIKTPKFR
ncbi:DUF6089 family protein [Sediminitomix flava]|uniref:Outer membrane protein with beta-barrel domain n=1 Tax=Sediminitomix flava TaxID=379075 RepID=A0A315ZBK2_SEDFL|nr:DUF6089 family protein [Sediminitomix flava]PWJ42740.1 outer membrane protein with beta-barrel domain [Sediminitomix flava]